MRGVVSEYLGESSRTGFLRGGEHLESLKSRSSKSPLWKHCVEDHSGQEVNFSMKVVRSHKTPLTRQVHESVEIDNSSARILMNSKCEYAGSKIPRIVIEGSSSKSELEEGQEQESQSKESSRKGGWTINNLKKRKRDQAQQGVAELSVAECESSSEVENSTKKRKIWNEPGVAKEGTPDCGQAQLNNVDENDELYLAVERVEICQNIANEMVNQVWVNCSSAQQEGLHLCSRVIEEIIGEVCHTLPKAEQCHTPTKEIEGRKRRLFKNEATQPSMQPRRKRRKEIYPQSIKDVEIKVERKLEGNNQKARNIDMKNWWTQTMVLKRENTAKLDQLRKINRKSKPNPSKESKSIKTFGKKSSRGKTKLETSQKTKITQFFKMDQTGAAGTQCDNFILSNLPQQHWGGESAVIGRTEGGKQLAQARQGVGGNIRIKKPSDLQDQDQVRVRHRGESIKGKDSTNHLAVQPSYTDEEFILNKLEMHL